MNNAAVYVIGPHIEFLLKQTILKGVINAYCKVSSCVQQLNAIEDHLMHGIYEHFEAAALGCPLT